MNIGTQHRLLVSVAGGSKGGARRAANELHRVGGRSHLQPAGARAGQETQTRRGAPTPPRPSLYEYWCAACQNGGALAMRGVRAARLTDDVRFVRV